MDAASIDQNRFSDREPDALHEMGGAPISTTSAMSELANDAGAAQPTTRGDDRTCREGKMVAPLTTKDHARLVVRQLRRDRGMNVAWRA